MNIVDFFSGGLIISKLCQVAIMQIILSKVIDFNIAIALSWNLQNFPSTK